MFDNDRFNKSCEWCRNMNKMYSVKESSLAFAEWCYRKGKVDGAREFAEWLVDKGILGNRCIYNGEITDYGKVYLAEWQKGEEE